MIITNGRDYAIQPEAIDPQADFWQVFGDLATELAASWVVRFCQKRETGWAPFTVAELVAFYRVTPGNTDIWLGGLIELGLLVLRGGQLFVTGEFVDRCFEAAELKPESCSYPAPAPYGAACAYC